MIHYDVSHIISSREESDNLRDYLDHQWYALKLGVTNSPTQNIISAVIYKDEADAKDRGGWLLLKYPTAQRINKKD